jgi:hypothetical protein
LGFQPDGDVLASDETGLLANIPTFDESAASLLAGFLNETSNPVSPSG